MFDEKTFLAVVPPAPKPVVTQPTPAPKPKVTPAPKPKISPAPGMAWPVFWMYLYLLI